MNKKLLLKNQVKKQNYQFPVLESKIKMHTGILFYIKQPNKHRIHKHKQYSLN